MKEDKTEYYVYVYIDPRNFEEFYYGKGKGSRKNAHLSQDNDTEKVKRINAIRKEGLEPIIKVIAKGLTEHEAFLIEKTLIWKLGKSLLNISSGKFADKFRKHDTFHLDLAGFDFKNGLYYVNVGQGPHRCWDDCKRFGFLSAGQGPQFSDPIRTLEPGDIVVAYLKRYGYVGIGRVLQKGVKVADFKYQGRSLKHCDLEVPNIFQNSDNDKSEYLVKIDWIKTVDNEQAKWQKNKQLFTTQLVKASLQRQRETREFLEMEFEIDFRELLLTEDHNGKK
ncbi:MAG TPA: GIY-YIG nuclease family protein [Saprospiraceae bacterium]|nr:GIY-YIG nuclease family protein [Saprospiraceae bacterium]